MILKRSATDQVLAKKEQQLVDILSQLDQALVAFSGGVDSSFLLSKAVRVNGSGRVMAVTVASELSPPGEAEEAAELASKLNVKHNLLQLDLTADPEIRSNTAERCYFCKHKIFGRLSEIAAAESIKVVLDGSNADDLADYRPGMRAIRELGIRSPLLEVSLGKEEIRILSKRAGLATWNKPAAACLATRFPYGEELIPARIRKVAEAERFLRRMGIQKNLRVRCHGDLARIEVDASELEFIKDIRETVAAGLSELGFSYITLDLAGFSSGSMNRSLSNEGQ